MPVPKKSTSKKKNLVFDYKCYNLQGKPITGDLHAPNITLAKANLRRQGFSKIKLTKRRKPLMLFKKKILSGDVSSFARQMATMLTAGVPLVQSLDIVARGNEHDEMKKVVNALKLEVESGRTFSEALHKFPLLFDHLFCSLVASGETSGALEGMLDRIATYKEKSESLRKKIKKAMSYPMAVLIVALIVTGILLVFVVPQFEELFQGFGADLPTFTLLVISLSEFMQSWWYVIIGFFILLGYIFSHLKKTSQSFRNKVDKLILKLPIVGDIMHKAAIARYARTLSITFAAGVPLVEALDSVAGATGNIVYSDAVEKIKDEVSTGSQVQAAMRNTQLFPNMVIQMIAIGEESGSLDAMLGKVANIYEEEVDTAVDSLSSLLEPLIMAVLGVLVGGLVIAMYLPIFQMGSVI
jgi:type IV pilus assembly protein PilC